MLFNRRKQFEKKIINEEYYITNPNINKLEAHFQTAQNFYKVSSFYFNYDKDKIEDEINNCLKKENQINADLIRAIQFSNRLFLFINDNSKLYEFIKNILEKVTQLRQKNRILNEKYFSNSFKILKFVHIKKNISKLKEHIILLQKLKTCADCLSVLSKNKSKVDLVFYLINKSKDLLDQSRILFKNKKSLYVLNDFEKEFLKYTSNSSEKGIKNLFNIISSSFEMLFNIKSSLLQLINYKDDSNSNNSIKIKEIIYGEIINIFSKSNIKDILNFILKLDDEFYSKINIIFNNEYKILLEKHFSLKEEITIHLYINIQFDKLKSIIEYIKEFNTQLLNTILLLTNQKYKDTKKTELIMNNYSEEFHKLEDNIYGNSIIFIIKSHFENEIQYRINKFYNNDVFYIRVLKIYKSIKEIKKYIENEIDEYSNHKEYSYLLVNEQLSLLLSIENTQNQKFLMKLFVDIEEYLIDSSKNDDFLFAKEDKSKSIQLLIDIILNINIHEVQSKQDTIEYITNSFITINQQDENITLKLLSKRFKFLKSSKNIIETFLSFVILYLLNNDYQEYIISTYTKIINNTYTFKRSLILDGKGLGINFQKLSQHHIISLIADINIINNLLIDFIIIYSPSEKYITYMNNLKASLDSINEDLKISLIEIYKDQIKNSISIFSSIDFQNYPIPTDNTINKHLKIFNTLINLYNNCVNSLENTEINIVFQEFFNIFFFEYEKITKVATKMDVEEQQVQ